MNTIPHHLLAAAISRELNARGWTQLQLHEVMAGRFGGNSERYQGRWRRSIERGAMSVWHADEYLVALGLTLHDLPVDQPTARVTRTVTKPAGVHGYLTDQQLRALHLIYERDGVSVRTLAAQVTPRTRYPNAKTCANGIFYGWRRLGLPTRDQGAATAAANRRRAAA